MVVLSSIDKYARPMYGATKLKCEKRVRRDGCNKPGYTMSTNEIAILLLVKSFDSLRTPQFRNIC